MTRILDQYGQPIDSGALKEPQTSRIAQLANTYLTPMLGGLTPARLAGHLRAADDGDLTRQHRLFADMEERDSHLLAEMGKRKLAAMALDWAIVPPRNATAAEKANAEWVKEVLTDAADPFEDLLLALMEGVGHGFAPVELEWRKEGAALLPAFFPRPQEWFRLSQDRRQLRLQDASASGAALQPFGWVFHTHGKAKTGYSGRMGIHRALVWPFIYKSYALGDFAEFLETYGLPIVVGKYFSGASADEKASLMRAVTALGHDARAIMPADMSLEIQQVTGSGAGTPHLAMIDWADRAQSKVILGQTSSAEAKATGLGSGIADMHNEVRHDIRNADAMQIAGTITRDLIYPLLALNRGGVDSLARCPRLVFDTGEAEDLTAYADALPKLTAIGVRIDPEWVSDKLRIPPPPEGKPALGEAAPASAGNGGKPPAALAALSAELPGADPTPITALAERLDTEAAPALDLLLAQIRDLAGRADSLEALSDALLAAYADLPSDHLAEVMALGFAVADLAGRADVAAG